MPRKTVLALLALLHFVPNSTTAANRPAVLRVGQPAPSITAKDTSGEDWTSVDRDGNPLIVVYFYPSNASTIAVKLAKTFRDEYAVLDAERVELVGISPESIDANREFHEKNEINYTLLADPEGKVAEQFGVPVRKSEKGARLFASRVFAIDPKGKIVFKRTRISHLSDINPVLDVLVENFWANREDREPVWMPRTKREWRRVLSVEQFRVTRQSHTERAFTGRYWDHKGKGEYRCVCCGLPLFASTTKFKSGTGWPSFWNPVDKGSIKFERDTSLGVVRTEVQCARCKSHLGHVFDDGPAPTGKRYCINSASLAFEKILRDSDEE